MNRILMIGNTGAGKTTFAKQLAGKLGIPLVHLDKLYWCGAWEHLSRDAFDLVLQEELDKPRWIIDGNFNRTLPHRLKYCDTVIYLDYSVLTCLLGITHRTFHNLGKTRSDMGGNCPERFDRRKISLYRNVLSFNREHRKKYCDMLRQAEHVNVIILHSRKQAGEFLSNL